MIPIQTDRPYYNILLLLMTKALLSPEFWQLVVFLMVAAFCAALNQDNIL